MKFRVARHSNRLEAVATFYRDRIGLPELGRFVDHDGYDGVFLDIPGTGAHLEFTAGGDHPAPRPHPESVLVLYVDTQEELEAIAVRVLEHEVTPATDAAAPAATTWFTEVRDQSARRGPSSAH